ncbi:MAG: tRNA(fMet)-specific endonuclease VapC [uncultured Sulfurovum sp.]|uniref:tRNA(fMet)-specific endonuclease VapC n=1 Tax=uncultured Sulfurovum sp. TaxID=269237 RepID=A0A6S6UCE4_9BACT|nr:MAG: tRNA(fMet)-specific endonuclease VapC [uncultured Sulfurovum sp.]
MSGSNNVLLDSNILIYLSQKKLSIDEVFEDNCKYFISIISYMEILSYNFTSKEEENFIHKLLSFFEIIDITKNIADQVIKLKKQRKIKLPDAIIVATALHKNMTLYTNDQQLHSVENLKTKFFSVTH